MSEEKKTPVAAKTPAAKTAPAKAQKSVPGEKVTVTEKKTVPAIVAKPEAKAPVKATAQEVKAAAAPVTAGKTLKVTYIKSVIGYNKKQIKIVQALGLGKLNSSNILPDNASVRGSIFHVKHLVKVEEIN